MKLRNAFIVTILLFSTFQAFGIRDTLIVGVKITPPFIMKNKGGYSGISIELWQIIAQKLNKPYVFKEYDLVGLLEATEKGEVDVCINPYTVTAERIERMDFTQPMYISGIGAAVHSTPKQTFLQFIKQLFSIEFIKSVSALFFLLLFVGFSVWIIERRKNTNHFQKGLFGIFEGFWWSAVTMCTIGYGDKVPITTSGRILGIIWMFTAVIIISSFTANISSTLTVSRLQHNISSMKDLKKYKTGTVAGSRSAKYLLDKNFIYEEYTNAEVLLNALDSNIIEMAIYDAPVLNYYILNHKYSHTLELLPNKFNTDYYSYSLPKNHPLYSDINILLINELNTVAWQNILTEYDLNEN